MVPRTFIGPIIIALVSNPFVKLIIHYFENIFLAQLIVRFTLACFVLSGFFHFVQAIRKSFNRNIEKLTILITLSQFHFVFYSSRTLPNTFALILFLHAYAFWLKDNQKLFVWLSAANILIFRSELCIISGIMLLISLLNRRLSLLSLILNGLLATVLFVGSSVLIDSWFWTQGNQIVWPEGQVLWFNTYLNKSSEWGTMPFLWYFYSAIPRATLLSLFLVPLAFLTEKRKTFVKLFLPAIGFVFVYSFLPHKELRFIIYVIPLLNALASKGLNDLQRLRLPKYCFKNVIMFFVYAHLLVNLIISSGFLYVSSINYPGGSALMKLHEIESKTAEVNVHIDAFSAETGISRFLELNRDVGWLYDKTENLKPVEKLKFTHLLLEADSEDDKRLAPFKQSHRVHYFVRGYDGVHFIPTNNNLLPIPRVKKSPKIFLLKKIQQ